MVRPSELILRNSDQVDGLHQRQIANDQANAKPSCGLFKQTALPHATVADEKDRLIGSMGKLNQLYDGFTRFDGHHHQHPQIHFRHGTDFEQFRVPLE